jgi:hypothetical protein
MLNNQDFNRMVSLIVDPLKLTIQELAEQIAAIRASVESIECNTSDVRKTRTLSNQLPLHVLSKRTGYTIELLMELKRKGLPCTPTDDGELYDIKLCRKWLKDNGYNPN